MPPKRPKFHRDITPAEVDVVCSLLLTDANERYRKQVRYVTDDVKELVKVWLTSNSFSDLAEQFHRAIAACDSDWLSILYFSPDFVQKVGAMPHGKQLPVFPPGMTWKQAKEELVRQSLVRNQYNRSATERELGMGGRHVYRTIERSEGRIAKASTREKRLVELATRVLAEHKDWMEVSELLAHFKKDGFTCTQAYCGRILIKNSRTFERDRFKFRLKAIPEPAP